MLAWSAAPVCRKYEGSCVLPSLSRRGTVDAFGGIMSTATLPIRKFMSICPHVVGATKPLSYAQRMMLDNGIRHMPVVSEGVIVGLLCERALERLAPDEAGHTTVADVMSPNVYVVDASTSAREVATTMADRKIDAAVVTYHGNPVGIFTTVDACRAVATLATGAATD